MRSRMALAVVAALLALSTPSDPFAGLRSMKTLFIKETQTQLSLEKDGIRIADYRFARLTRGGINPFKLGSGPAIHFTVRNEGSAPKDFSLAVALFDRLGNLVGASTSSPAGKLEAGETKEVKVVFRDVNQNLGHAASMQVSLETRL